VIGYEVPPICLLARLVPLTREHALAADGLKPQSERAYAGKEVDEPKGRASRALRPSPGTETLDDYALGLAHTSFSAVDRFSPYPDLTRRFVDR